MLSKERKIFKHIYNQRLDRLGELTKKTDYGDLKFVVQGTGSKTNFTEVEDHLVFLNSIRTNKITKEKTNLHEEFNKYQKKNKD